MNALREFIGSGVSAEHVKEAVKNVMINKKHFDAAIKTVRPTILPEARNEFKEKAEDFVKYAYV